MSFSRASPLIVSRLTGAGNGATARMSTQIHRGSSAVEFGMRLGDHLDDADHRLHRARVVEEAEVAFLHCFHVVAGLEVAHAVPLLPGVALRDLMVPAPGLGLRLEEPVLHRPPPIPRAAAAPAAPPSPPSTVSAPSSTSATAAAIGSSTPVRAPSWQAARAVATPSTVPPGRAAPAPSARPSAKFRDCAELQVSDRSPSPDSPASVSARAPIATASRVISAKPRVISAARAEWPSRAPSAMPQAMATTFFSAPPSCAPVRSSVR